MRTLKQIQQEIRAMIGKLDEADYTEIIDYLKIDLMDLLTELDTDIAEVLENLEEII